jgi:hypothetical protein
VSSISAFGSVRSREESYYTPAPPGSGGDALFQPPNMPPLVLPLRLHASLLKVDPHFRRLNRDDSRGVRIIARGASAGRDGAGCAPEDVEDAPEFCVAADWPLQAPWSF